MATQVDYDPFAKPVSAKGTAVEYDPFAKQTVNTSPATSDFSVPTKENLAESARQAKIRGK